MTYAINLANEFSRFPGGRFRSDGPYSAEHFRDGYLIPALRACKTVRVELDGAEGYSSSFLEEVFGGAIRAGFKPEQIIPLCEEDPSLVIEARQYMEYAEK